MAGYGLKRYLGMVFIGIVVAPAIILSLLAIRAISHEEAYIEKQMEGTLAAEVAHVSAVVKAELAGIQQELDGTIVIPVEQNPLGQFERWKQRSDLVDIPFLLSSDHEILWPIAGPETDDDRAGREVTVEVPESETTERRAYSEAESAFLERQQAFLTDEEKTPVYENIAVAYEDAILDVPDEAVSEIGDAAGSAARPEGESEAPSGLADHEVGRREKAKAVGGRVAAGDLDTVVDRQAAGVGAPFEQTLAREGTAGGSAAESTLDEWAPQGEDVLSPAGAPVAAATREEGSDETRKQSALSRFLQSESVRKKVYDKAESEGQEVLYRNVEVADASRTTEAARRRPTGTPQVLEGESRRSFEEVTSVADGKSRPDKAIPAADGAPGPPTERAGEPHAAPVAERGEAGPSPESVGRIRSIFISEPLSFSEIVAGGKSGIIPRTTDGGLQLLYWLQAPDGKIVGCLIDSRELRDRLVGSLPGIYSAVRILTILDELGRPLIIPPGHDDREWQRPFVAEEISEMLPRWEVAAYLTDPDVISSRAQVATSVMWMLILILFVSIVAGGVLVARSTYAQMRLAQQRTSFVANVSHELKTPLTSIRMFAEMLRDGRQPDEQKQKQYLDIMSAETERLTRLVNNVLDFSRMERGEKRYSIRTVDLAALSAGVVESQRTRLEHNGFEVMFSGPEEALMVRADDEALKQALVNLLSNAEKYSTDVRRIEVSAGREEGAAVVRVGDRGIGVPAAKADIIFKEFYRIDDTLTSKVKGAGLGLTIARRIIRDQGGDIRYRAREGGGSIFEIVLPVVEERE